MADEIGRTWQNMRACYFCSLIKTLQQFEKEGCDNCSFLRLDRSAEKARECTTPNFEGMIALNDPDQSWVARWQSINGTRYRRGMYAISVSGLPPSQYIQQAENNGFTYINRDQHYEPKRRHH